MSKNHDALPVPDTEVYARPMGKVQWTCPNCGQDHPFRLINWRRANVSCVGCHARYQVGLGFSTDKQADSYIMGKWNSYTANRINPSGTPYDGGKVYGSVEWQCPVCSHPQRDFLPYNSQLECNGCAKPYFISLLFYRLPLVGRLKLRAPFDSIVKGINETIPQTNQSIPVSEANQSSGAPSSSPRGDR